MLLAAPCDEFPDGASQAELGEPGGRSSGPAAVASAKEEIEEVRF